MVAIGAGEASAVVDQPAVPSLVSEYDEPSLTVLANNTWRGTAGRVPMSTVDAFVEADWSFASADSRMNLHPYPARFVRAIPDTALALLAPKLGVLDPFCGSGTTLEAGAAAGLASVGVDLNPIACLMSRVRLGEWRSIDDELSQRHAAGLIDAANSASEEDLQALRARIPRVDHWFAAWAQRVLAGSVGYLRSIDDSDPWRDRVALSISAAVVKLSRQESDTRYAAVDKKLDERGGIALLGNAVLRTASYLRERDWSGTAQVQVHERDARDLAPIPDASLDSAVFSPPYPNAYEYWLYHKYRMYWLDHDPIAVREAEIGARPHYFKTNAHTEADFARQMSEVFAEIARVLRPASPIVIVVGDSIIRGRVIDNRDLLFDVARTLGLTPRGATLRTISRSRSSFNSAHGRGRNAEHVLLLESPR